MPIQNIKGVFIINKCVLHHFVYGCRMRLGKRIEAESYERVTIMFSDISDFMDVTRTMEPILVVNFLNSIYNMFDSKIERYDVYKVRSIYQGRDYVCDESKTQRKVYWFSRKFEKQFQQPFNFAIYLYIIAILHMVLCFSLAPLFQHIYYNIVISHLHNI